jgi:hypothetical protein
MMERQRAATDGDRDSAAHVAIDFTVLLERKVPGFRYAKRSVRCRSRSANRINTRMTLHAGGSFMLVLYRPSTTVCVETSSTG